MEVRQISETELAGFIAALPGPMLGLFLQSSDWLKFQQSLGTEVEALGFWQNNKLVGTALTLKRNLPLNNHYIFVPRGPVVLNTSMGKDILEVLVKYYQPTNAMFIRVEPSVLVSDKWRMPKGFTKSISIHPPATLLTDLSLSEADLLKAMHQKTRYNINLALKKNLTWELHGIEGLDDFISLIKTTAERDGFKIHTPDYYKKMISYFGSRSLSSNLAMRIVLVKSKQTTLAASFVVWYQGVVTYLHGASANQDRQLMAPYLLHWQTILEAKKLGFQYYDWWGINTPVHQQPNWQGITRFKKGFGGSEVNYVGTYDYYYKASWYWLYKLARRIIRS